MIVPVILSGGSGSRLWPLSRQLYPKQFHALTGPDSLLQETVTRLDGIEGVEAPMVVCNDEHRFMVAEQLREIGVTPAGIFLEPVGRNTAPAVAVAALAARKGDEQATLLVLPADHVIGRREAFYAAVNAARPLAEDGWLMTFGIVPTGPETGFGYIRAGGDIAADGGQKSGAFEIAEFVEKPDQDTAQAYVSSGDYLWNSGMFMFSATRYLEELEAYEPEIVRCCREALDKARTDFDFVRLDADVFANCPGNSIDYAVMEKSQRCGVVPLDAQWNDVGSWSALWEVGAQDEQGNVTHGDVLVDNVTNSFLYSEGRLVAAIGLADHVVVETDDAVLVAAKSDVQNVKKIVERLNQMERGESISHRKVFRPWGAFQGIDRGERFQVKRLIIKPGARLSLQRHQQRAEHWVVVTGRARVVRGEETFELGEDQSTYIPLGTMHQLENVGEGPLEIIEVQTGGYLGEDDIERFEDRYGRI